MLAGGFRCFQDRVVLDGGGSRVAVAARDDAERVGGHLLGLHSSREAHLLVGRGAAYHNNCEHQQPGNPHNDSPRRSAYEPSKHQRGCRGKSAQKRAARVRVAIASHFPPRGLAPAREAAQGEEIASQLVEGDRVSFVPEEDRRGKGTKAAQIAKT
jgi:hypothetical protein